MKFRVSPEKQVLNNVCLEECKFTSNNGIVSCTSACLSVAVCMCVCMCVVLSCARMCVCMCVCIVRNACVCMCVYVYMLCIIIKCMYACGHSQYSCTCNYTCIIMYLHVLQSLS